jgi:hypothetical protein
MYIYYAMRWSHELALSMNRLQSHPVLDENWTRELDSNITAELFDEIYYY